MTNVLDPLSVEPKNGINLALTVCQYDAIVMP
jgi:hypothetical protein